MPRTPIAGILYSCEPATGSADVELLEAGTGLTGALKLVSRRTRFSDGAVRDAGALPVGDVDAIVVELRRQALGDRVVARGDCGACGSPFDIRFSLVSFEAHQRPRRPRNVTAADQPGSWSLRGSSVTFRIPTADDVLGAADADDPLAMLRERCIYGAASQRDVRRAEAVMARLAPTLQAEVNGQCPNCAKTAALGVDARELCLADLRFLAGSVLENVHLLAWAYNWREADILALPSTRRTRYADWVRGTLGEPLSAEAFGG